MTLSLYLTLHVCLCVSLLLPWPLLHPLPRTLLRLSFHTCQTITYNNWLIIDQWRRYMVLYTPTHFQLQQLNNGMMEIHRTLTAYHRCGCSHWTGVHKTSGSWRHWLTERVGESIWKWFISLFFYLWLLEQINAEAHIAWWRRNIGPIRRRIRRAVRSGAYPIWLLNFRFFILFM